jgi:hypothetical protein
MVTNTVLSVLSWVVAIRDTFARSERGQGIMEYSILVGFIALIAAAAFIATPFSFTEFRTDIQDCINFSASCG